MQPEHNRKLCHRAEKWELLVLMGFFVAMASSFTLSSMGLYSRPPTQSEQIAR
jgi:hypothetical protein